MSTEQYRALSGDDSRRGKPAAVPPPPAAPPVPETELRSSHFPAPDEPRGIPAEAQEIPLSAIRDEAKNSPRLTLSRPRVRQFRQIMREQGVRVFPPVILAGPREDGSYAPLDGRHRIAAAGERKAETIHAFVVPWTNEREFFVRSLGLSARNGLPLTQREKRLAVFRLLREFPDGSVREVADIAGTSHNLVFTCRKQLQQGLAPERKRYRRKTAADHAETLLEAFDAMGALPENRDEARQLPAALASAARRHYADADPERELEVLAGWIAEARALLRAGSG